MLRLFGIQVNVTKVAEESYGKGLEHGFNKATNLFGTIAIQKSNREFAEVFRMEEQRRKDQQKDHDSSKMRSADSMPPIDHKSTNMLKAILEKGSQSPSDLANRESREKSTLSKS